jgi:hypothetical protein
VPGNSIRPPLNGRLAGTRSAIEGETPKTAVPLPTFADGVAGMEVIDAIRKSAADKGALVSLR